VTFSMTMLTATITRYNLQHNTFGYSKKLHKKINQFIEKDYDEVITAAWIVLLVALVFAKFGDALFA
jgi:hypothetical protein